jgi:predicted NACHT family NTPase
MIILREGGFGKTTLLKHVTLVYGQGKYRKHKVHKLIPFLIFLWEWKKDGGFLSHSSLPSLSELINKDHLLKISEGKEPLNLPVRWVNKLLVSGKALVMFDGFDELPEDQRQRISHWISEQMQKYKYVVFIITSRPAVYKDYVAEHSMMPLTIQDFSPNQQADFVKRWYLCQSDAFANIKKVATSKSENLLSQLRDPCRPELQQLAKNPLLLYLLVNFHSSSPNKELPRRRIELYTKVCKLFLEDRPKARGIKPLLTEGKSQEVLQLLALHLVEKDRFMIVNEELLSFLREIPVFTLEDVAPEDFLCQMVEVGELLVKYRSNEYEFRHYSFQGYLAATCLAQKKDEVDDEVFYNWNIEIWRETILFYTSYLGPDRLTKLLRRACYGNKLESISVKLAFDCLHEYGEQENLDDNLLVRLKALTIDDPKAKLYVKLIDSLKESRWGEADVATYKLMLKVANSEERGWLRTLDVESFPDEDLQEINKLWVKYSDKKFGFRDSQKIIDPLFTLEITEIAHSYSSNFLK